MIQYAVVLHEGRWKVRRDDKNYGPYPSREVAPTSAIDAAHISGRNDRAAQVLSQREEGEIQAEWTFGVDFYPPQGTPIGTIRTQGSAEEPDWPMAEGWNRLASTALAWSRSWAPL